MYDLRNVLSKEPIVIAGAIRSVLFVLVLMSLVVLDEKQLAGIAIALELVLGLFARQASTPVSSPTLAAGTEVKVENSSDTVTIQPSPPGPTGTDGTVLTGGVG